MRRVILLGVEQAQCGALLPHIGCRLSKCGRVIRAGQDPVQHSVDGKFAHHEIARDARKMEHQRLDMELAVLGTRQLFFDIRKIAVVHIDIAAVYVKPCATIENPATPCADLGDITLPTDLAEILGIEVTTVIDRQIPITIRTMSSLGAGAAQCHRFDGR
ncbi:Uncharacterised protein [Mycobacteroides abscessus subsp. abscessus]|nr:Uncharacterised protein [Mycobacteroides abscessus subsp. abscessus]SIK53049.1 Uncharacterised protein [Mycobacteroides abscessus subsp. abscessus]